MSKIFKPKAISGFPEWLPEERIVEQQWMDHIRRVFESYGYCSIETPSVEELDAISAKGEVDKEIYVLERLHKDEDDTSEARLALHFDQTVPLARYVAQHFNDLVFPFKRYQMQRVWRGERPQMGRMREFYQCDIDIINVDHLPIHFDAEVAAVMYEVLNGLNQYADIGKVQLRISNRKILMGLLEETDIDVTEAIRVIDKREKLSENDFSDQLMSVFKGGSTEDLINKYNFIMDFLRTGDGYKKQALENQIQFLESNLEKEISDTAKEGINELITTLKQLSHLPEGAVVADLSIVRGLDYYTGTVYETQLLDVPEFTGSVCSGGRYDDLAGGFINKHLPGVGISIGFTRLFDVLRQTGRIQAEKKSPAHILMVLPNEDQREEASSAARTLRGKGYNVELYHAPQKLKKQLAYAERKGIPYVWFPPFESGQAHEVKNMATGNQTEADPENWSINK